MYCPDCGAEYREAFTECSDCRIPLLPGSPPEKQIREVDLVDVFRAETLILLSMAESSLKDAGISYSLKGNRLYAAGFPVNRPVWIQVASQDEETAREVLANLEEPAE